MHFATSSAGYFHLASFSTWLHFLKLYQSDFFIIVLLVDSSHFYSLFLSLSLSHFRYFSFILLSFVASTVNDNAM